MKNATSTKDQVSTHPNYRPDIDGLRAVAVLSVVIFHAFPSALRGGFIGVDIFFVISGFLISTILFLSLEREKFSFLDFYVRRVRRIFPALLLVLLTCMGFGWSLLLSGEYEELGKHVAAGATFLSNFALWNESGYFDPSADQKPLLHLWSLAIEEQFYLFWPALLWIAYRRHKSFLALTLFIAIASFLINLVTVKIAPVAAFYSPLSRFWELMIGGLLAFLKLRKPRHPLMEKDICSLAGIALIVVGLLCLSADREFPGWWALLPTIGAFLILFASPRTWFNRTILSNRLMVSVGLISYPLYLWHWPMLYLSSLISTLPSHVTRFLAVVVSIVLAWLTFVLIEKPIRHAKGLSRSSLYLSAGMAFCGLFGLAVYWMDGFGFRLPQQFAQFVQLSPASEHSDCFLKDKATFLPKCTQPIQRPVVFVWGDSHANALYAGLKPMQDKHEIGALEVTGASCPPLLNFKSNGNTRCEDINRYALDRIRNVRPEVVLLNANWAADSVDLSKLDYTLQQLQGAGAEKIVLIGPVPRWSGTLLRSILRCWHPHSKSEQFPLYSKCGLDPQVQVVDEKLREITGRFNIKYFSAYDALCNASGCLTHVKDVEGDELSTYDYGHLSPGAARYLINAVTKDMFPIATAQTQRP